MAGGQAWLPGQAILDKLAIDWVAVIARGVPGHEVEHPAPPGWLVPACAVLHNPLARLGVRAVHAEQDGLGPTVGELLVEVGLGVGQAQRPELRWAAGGVGAGVLDLLGPGDLVGGDVMSRPEVYQRQGRWIGNSPGPVGVVAGAMKTPVSLVQRGLFIRAEAMP